MNTIYFDSQPEGLDTDANEKLAENAINAALLYMDFSMNAEISVTFCDNETIHKLNREYRSVDRATDVLSFPMYSFENGDVPEDDGMLGDIVISVERAKEQAKEYGHSLEREISFLCVHSVLHLLGYDHERSAEEEKEMFALQDKIMDRLGLTR